MSRGERTGWLLAAAVVAALALSGAVAFRPASASSSKRREQVGEGSAWPSSGFWPSSSPPPAPTLPAPGAKLDEQWIVNGKKVSILEKKKPATGKGPDGIDNRTRGAGTGTGLGLDG